MTPVYKLSDARSLTGTATYYSSMLAGNAAYSPIPPSSYDLLQSEVLSASTASVQFSNLNSTYGSDYQHLELRFVVRSSASVLVDDMWLYLNSDSGANYSNHYIRASGSNVVSGAITSDNHFYDAGYANTGASAPTNHFGGGIITITDAFNTNKFKTARWLGAAPYQSTAGYVAGISSAYLSLNAVDSIQFDLSNGSFVSGSRFGLYGWRAS